MKPIPFPSLGVRATLEGRKTQHRLVIKPQPYKPDSAHDWRWEPGGMLCYDDYFRQRAPYHCPYGQVGDKLWVRETWMGGIDKTVASVDYRADGHSYGIEVAWRSSSHMPQWASRLTLEITGVRVERIQEIDAYGALQEGISLDVPPNCDIPEPPPEYAKWSKARRKEWEKDTARTVYFAQSTDADNHIQAFTKLWDTRNAKRGCGWKANPWVWVLEYERWR